MADFFEDGDVFDFGEPQEQEVQETSTDAPIQDDELVYEDSDFDTIEEPSNDSDYVSDLLKAKGLDRNRIQIYDENGDLQEVKFDDLSDEEKVMILGGDAPDERSLFSDDELNAINYLRQNGISLADFAQIQRQAAIDEYLAGQPKQTDIDSYSDEEVIAYDFIQRFGDEMTDEEIDAEIERLKLDQDSFNKRVSLLRNTYKAQEMDALKALEEQDQQRRQADEQNFINTYYNAASGFNDIQGVTLDNNDKDELLSFVLDKDAANRTAFARAMDDPNNVLRMAWFLLHGEEVFDATTDYYKAEIAKARSSQAPRSVNKTAARKSTSRSQDKFNFNV